MRLTRSPAVIQDDRRVTSEALQRCADQLAKQIKSAGIGRVAMRAHRADLVLTTLVACEKTDCECVLLRGNIGGDAALLKGLDVQGVVEDDFSLRRIEGKSSAEGFAIVIPTAGTTGRPKFARHKIGNLLDRVRIPKEANSIWLLTYHPATFAGIQVLLTCLVGGGDLVAVSAVTVTALAKAASAYSPTHISGTPTFWRAFVPTLGEGTARFKPRQITLGGEIADQGTLDLLRATFPDARITHIYASNEAGALFAVHDVTAGFPQSWFTTGIDGVNLRIRNDILEVQSPRAMERYVGSTAPAPLTADGWIVTNDLVKCSNGRASFLGRADALINVGGAKVSPEEVERALLALHGVVDVRVFSAPNPITGAVVGADVVLARGLDPTEMRSKLVKHARAVLEPYKVPRLIRFTNDVQRSDAGKKSRAPS
jgi:acyl-coenzyme A synthetase/AMP-(fatty) acid ligase